MSEQVPVSQKNPYAFAFALIVELGIEIAVPAIILAILGKYLDGRFSTSPKYTVIGFMIAFIASATIIVKRAKVLKAVYDKQI